MAGIGAWNVAAGSKSNLSITRKDCKAVGGAIEHKNRPEAVYVVISSWVKPKLMIAKAKASMVTEPQSLAIATALDFEKEIDRVLRKVGSFFDSKYFDPNSIITTVDYSPRLADVAKRQFFELEINIDTVNTIDRFDQPAPNPNNGKVEMISYKNLEKPMTDAVNKILGMDVFSQSKGLVTFSLKKTDK